LNYFATQNKMQVPHFKKTLSNKKALKGS